MSDVPGKKNGVVGGAHKRRGSVHNTSSNRAEAMSGTHTLKGLTRAK